VILGLVYGYIPYLILVLYAGLDRIDPSPDSRAGRDLGLGKFATFWRVTLPLSRQPILTGLLITVLPMIGDYFTNQLLSGAPNTSMIGNLIQGQLGTPGLQGQGAILSLLVLVVLLAPMILLRRGHQPRVPGGVMTSVTARSPAASPAPGRRRRETAAALAQPLAPPVVPGGLHLALPAVVAGADRDRRAVSPSTTASRRPPTRACRSAGTGATRSTRCSTTRSCKARCSPRSSCRPIPRSSPSPSASRSRWALTAGRSKLSLSFNYVMILSFVVPELIFGVAMFFVFTRLFSSVGARHAG